MGLSVPPKLLPTNPAAVLKTHSLPFLQASVVVSQPNGQFAGTHVAIGESIGASIGASIIASMAVPIGASTGASGSGAASTTLASFNPSTVLHALTRTTPAPSGHLEQIGRASCRERV